MQPGGLQRFERGAASAAPALPPFRLRHASAAAAPPAAAACRRSLCATVELSTGASAAATTSQKRRRAPEEPPPSPLRLPLEQTDAPHELVRSA
jgi:hypothetical protein